MKLLHLAGYTSVLLCAVPIVLYINLTWLCQFYWVRFTSSAPVNGTEYDFIVVGSGSAGSTVVGRLVEAGHKVLLLEAGGPSHWLMGIPGFPGFFMQSPYSWKTETPSYEWAKGHPNGVIGEARGKVLGGGSMLNWMAYMRGHSEDYNEWERMGNPGWGFKNVLEFFKKCEKFQGEFLDPGMEKYHGRDGKVGVQYTPHYYPFNKMMDDLFTEIGIPLGDINGQEENQGFFRAGRAQVTLTKSWRLGTYRSYVEPLLGSDNIDVLPFSHVTKVVFNGKRATGVEYERFGQRYNVRARKEVVLSAGAIGTPQLLMLSGVGPKEHLKEHNIPLIKDLPVGNNLHDHVYSFLSFTTNTSMLTKGPLEIANPWYHLQALFFQEGPLMDQNLGTNGYFHSKLNKDKKRPDLQLHTMACLTNYDWGAAFKDVMTYDPDLFNRINADQLDYPGISLSPTLLRPKSRGTLRLASSDPFDEPLFDPQYLSHPDDLALLIEGLKFSLSLADTKTFRRYDLRPAEPKKEPCDQPAYSDEFLKCHAKSWSNTIYHPVGTCKMGPDSDPGAVVDARLRVKGLDNLRVVDASIMPTIVGANTNAPTMMIGEKGAHMLIQDWQAGSTPQGQKPEKDEL